MGIKLYKSTDTDKTGDYVTIRIIGGSEKAAVLTNASIEDQIGTYNGGAKFTVTANGVKLQGGAVLQIESSKGRIESIHFGNVAKCPVSGKSQTDATRNVNLYPYTGNGYYGTYVWDDNTTFTKGHGVSKDLVKTNSVNFLTLGNPSDPDGEYVTLYNSNDATNKTTFETTAFGINIWVDETDATTAVSPTVSVVPATLTNVETAETYDGPTSVKVMSGDTDVTDNYTIEYLMAGMKPSATTTDPFTGTMVSKADGSGTTGEVPGSATIQVVAVPKTAGYNMAFGEYTVTSTTTYGIVLPYLPAGQDGLILYTSTNQWNSSQQDGHTSYIGAAVKTKGGKDISEGYTFSYSIDNDTYASLGADGKITSKSPTTDSNPTLTITATNGSETLTKSVKVTVKSLGTDKIKLHIGYPVGTDSIMAYSRDRFCLPRPNVWDDYGNMLEMYNSSTSNAGNFNTGVHYQTPRSAKLEKSTWQTIYYDCDVYGVGSKSNQAADYGLDTICVYYQPYNAIPYVVYDDANAADIQSKGYNWSNKGYATDSVYFRVNCQVRVPELSFSPEKIVLFQGGRLTPKNRQHVTARFYDRSSYNYDDSGNLKDDSKTLIYGYDFTYALYIPDSLKDEITVEGYDGDNAEQVEAAHYTDYGTGKEVYLPGKFYWTRKNWGNDEWQITFNKNREYELQYYIGYYNEYTYRTSSPVTATTVRYNVIKIPTYSVGWNADNIKAVGHWTQVETSNEPTKIKMFYGGWRNGTYWDGKTSENEETGYTLPSNTTADKPGTNRIGGWEDTWNDMWQSENRETYGKGYAFEFAKSDQTVSDSIKTVSQEELNNECQRIEYKEAQKDSVYSSIYERNITNYGNLLVEAYNADSLRYNGYIDYFDTFLSNTDDNAMDERNQQFSTYNYKEGSYYDYAQYSNAKGKKVYYNTAFTAPCKGNYLRFEPEEDGTVLLYLVQNGLCEYTGSFNKATDAKNNALCQMKWRPLFITDEKGKPVDMVGDDDPMFTNFCLDDSTQSAHKGYYTQSILRAAYNDADVSARIKSNISNAQIFGDCTYDWQSFQGTEDDKAHIVELWKKLKVGDQQSLVKLDNGGYVILTKGYVRYAFPVHAGKTYFVMQGGSKPEVGGFSFIPEGYQPDASRVAVSIPDVTLYTRTDAADYKDHKTVMESLSDSTNVNVTLVGHQIKTNEWTSFCLPFSLSETKVNELFGEEALVITPDIVRNGAVHFTQHAYRMMTAGRPYLVKVAKEGLNLGKNDTFTFNNVTIENTNPEIYNDTIAIDGQPEYVFKGFYDPTNIRTDEYFITQDGLYRNTDTEDFLHPGYSAIFTLSNGQSGAKLASMDISIMGEDGNGETTAILEVRNTPDGQQIRDVTNEDVYTLDGRYVGKGISTATLPSGVYVRGGKQILVQ